MSIEGGLNLFLCLSSFFNARSQSAFAGFIGFLQTGPWNHCTSPVLQTPDQRQYDHDQQHQSQSSARVITPARTIRRQGTGWSILNSQRDQYFAPLYAARWWSSWDVASG